MVVELCPFPQGVGYLSASVFLPFVPTIDAVGGGYIEGVAVSSAFYPRLFILRQKKENDSLAYMQEIYYLCICKSSK
jgi:hypothetical protein